MSPLKPSVNANFIIGNKLFLLTRFSLILIIKSEKNHVKNHRLLQLEFVFKVKNNEILSKNKTLTPKVTFFCKTELQCNCSSPTCAFLLEYQCQIHVVR
jgi:hypothetical protein